MPPLRSRTVTYGWNMVNAPRADAMICIPACAKLTPGTSAPACGITLTARPDQ